MNDELENFDDYVEDYEKLLKDQLSFFETDRDYFSAYKIDILKRLLPKTPKKILDFGSGVGLSLPHFLSAFPDSALFATDISKKSLDFVSKNVTDVTVIEDDALEGQRFDLVFLSGVVHHVPPHEREPLMKRLKTLSSEEGHLAIFEHNPFNPVTRRMVATCPFDKGVKLLTQNQMKTLLQTAQLTVMKADYCLFFPGFLKPLRPLESKLGWLPVGGQHFVIAK